MAKKAASADDFEKGQAQRDRAAQRSRQLSRGVAEIGPPPKRNEKLWKRYERNLFLFLQECFPHSTSLTPLSPSHKVLADRTQQAIFAGGKELFIVFRGYAKSTIQEASAIWSGGYGHSMFFVPIGATIEMATATLDSIQYEFETNDILMEIFPEVCHAARALEGVVQRAGKQTINGERTRIEWSGTRCVLPTVKGFRGSGAIIWPKGITGNLRGLRFKRPDGEQARPDFVMCDDLQTDESAASPQQCAKRISALRKTVFRLGGHKKSLAVTINATIIEPDDAIDQLTDSKKFPSIRSLKVPMLQSFSKVHETEWLGKYAELRATFSPDDEDDRARAAKAATAYYKQHRKKMDEGAVATWQSCYNEATELSAIQHAYNILVDDGEDAFMAECQNTPVREVCGLEILRPEEICRRQSDFGRGHFPAECSLLTFHCDVHLDFLSYEVWAFEPDFTCYMIEEGAFPDQKRKYYNRRNPPRKLRKLLPGLDAEATVTAAIDQFLHGAGTSGEAVIDGWPGIMHRTWTRADGVPMKIGSGLVDANGEMRDAVVKAVSRSPFSHAVRPAFGKGIGATHAPISAWPQTREQKNVGPEWIYTKPVAGEAVGVIFDTNYWKTRLHRALGLAKGSRGSARLYKADPGDHRMTADHITAETAHEVTVGSRTVYEFKLKPNCDNEKLDNAVGAMVAASRGGIANIKRQPDRKPRPKRNKVSYL